MTDNETPATASAPPELDQIAAALALFQAEMPTVKKSHTATVKSDKGNYSYTYAGLADVTETAMPLLAKHGLSFITLPGPHALEGVLLHSSGQSLHGSLPIGNGTPQQIGSSLTYMRRYLLGCMTGLVTDDDDDGAAASRRPSSKKAAAPAPEPWPEVVEQQRADAGLLDTTSSLARAMYAAINKAGIPEPERLEQVGLIIGRPIGSTKEMTSAEARRVLAYLDQKAGA